MKVHQDAIVKINRAGINIFYRIVSTKFLAVSTALFLALFFIVSSDRIHRNFYYLLVLLPFFVVFLREIPRELIQTRSFRIVLLFFAYFLLSLFWSDGVDGEVIYDVVRKEVLTAFFVLIVALLWYKGYQSYLMFGLVAGATLGVWLSIYDFYIQGGHSLSIRLEGIGRGEHSIKSSVMYGAVLLSFMGFWGEKNGKFVVTYWVMTFIVTASLLTFIVLTQSRGVLLSAVIAYVGVLLLRKRYKQISLFMVLAVAFIFYVYYEGAFVRMLSFDSARYAIWAQVLQQALDSLVIGYGIFPEQVIVIPGGRSFVHPHSIYLAHLLYGGVIGLSLLLFLMGSLLVSSWRLWSDKQDILPLGLVFYFLLIALFDFSTLIRSADVEWIFFWWLVALIVAAEADTAKPVSSS